MTALPNQCFDEIIVSRSMFSSHLPQVYERYIRLSMQHQQQAQMRMEL